ncbi:MAG: coenzyme F420 hydrogenase/dehydrogenase beta subunit N-terminal domain-containing protein [Candidatus Caldarchaeum sp.]
MKTFDNYACQVDEFGGYGEIFYSRSRDKRVLKRPQYGGTVTSLLMFALKEKIVDAVVVSTTSEEMPLKPVAKLVYEAEDVLNCSGSRYTYAPNLLALKEAFEMGVERLAVVGVPCQNKRAPISRTRSK